MNIFFYIIRLTKRIGCSEFSQGEYVFMTEQKITFIIFISGLIVVTSFPQIIVYLVHALSLGNTPVFSETKMYVQGKNKNNKMKPFLDESVY